MHGKVYCPGKTYTILTISFVKLTEWRTAGPKFYKMGDFAWMRVKFDEDIQIYSAVTADNKELLFQVSTRDGRIADVFRLVKGADTSEGFLGLPMSHWAYETIMTLSSMGIVDGILDRYFEPQNGTTRAHFSALLVRALKLGNSSGHPPMRMTSSAAAKIKNRWMAGPEAPLTKRQLTTYLAVDTVCVLPRTN